VHAYIDRTRRDAQFIKKNIVHNFDFIKMRLFLKKMEKMSVFLKKIVSLKFDYGKSLVHMFSES
jgi:hypothetical protein